MLSFFRQRRRFRIEQGVGAFMCTAALVYLLSPSSVTYHWVEQTYGFHYLPHLTVGGLVICGWILMALRRSSWQLFLVLTMPVLGFALIGSWYVLVVGSGSLFLAYEVAAFWMALQVLRAQQDQILAMIRTGDPS
jgi:hypothetical protein